MRLAALIGLIAAPAAALQLEFPGVAHPSAEIFSPAGSYFMPVDRYVDGPVYGVTTEGSVSRMAWRVGSGGFTTLQILAPLRDQIAKSGFEILFECEAKECGGFDFRYQLDVLPEPEMHVNLGDYRYLAAERWSEDGQPEYAALIVSRSANTGFVQLTTIGPTQVAATVTTSTKAPPPTTEIAGPVGTQLERTGHATLDDLVFQPGSARLDEARFASLQSLADYLATRPDRTVMLVGHTDSDGALDKNIELSRRRAQAVMDTLVFELGVSPEQIAAEGVGYLAPIASNLTAEGRTLNRRVEVILTSTE